MSLFLPKLPRLTYDRPAKAVIDRSDKSAGPTAGTETADPLEFLARGLVHIPDQGHVTTRYDGWYANRPRGMRRQAEPVALEAPPVIIPAPRLAPTEAARRWAALLPQIFEVNPARVSHLPRRDAGRRLHHSSVGDRSDPHAPPHPRRARGARRPAEPPIDAGPSQGASRASRASRVSRAPAAAPTAP